MTHQLRHILDLEQIDERLFRGRTRPTEVLRVFGGEVAGQALVAAARTVPRDRAVHSCTRTSCGRATLASPSSTESTRRAMVAPSRLDA
jgi:acyl-CoA thioesterase